MPDPDHGDAIREGIMLFADRRFFEAHEAWETVWLASTGELRLFVQGLIQLAAACVHVQRGNRRGAAGLFRSSLAKLAPFPQGYLGIDREETVAAARRLLSSLESGEPIDPLQTALPVPPLTIS